MKRLLSLPPNLVECFHDIAHVSHAEWFCTSDPIGARLGSGGGTIWLLESCRRQEAPDRAFGEWLSDERRILLHAGGQSRRLPGYAPSGKILTPVPVFRWERGQRLSQNLLTLQLPLYERILQKAPASLHTLVVSGDVYIRANASLPEIPEVDVVCFGLWADPSLATHHGVFVSDRKQPDRLDFMLQKPSLEELSSLSGTHLFLMDIGVWLLSDRAVDSLRRRSVSEDGQTWHNYDLYGEFGLALGTHPRRVDPLLNDLTVAILPLPGGEFYHYGTSRELISSTLAVQNLVRDQRAIMQRKVKPHPAMFVQNADVRLPLTADNSELWVENSCVGAHWTLQNRHVITGVPDNDWTLQLPAGCCVDVVPIGEQEYAARPYGFYDLFKGDVADRKTQFLEQPIRQWAADRGVTLPPCPDIQLLPLFPLCRSVEELGLVLRWMISEPALEAGKQIWESASRLSANDLSDQANLRRLTDQRLAYRRANWPLLAANHERSIFYQLDLSDAAQDFVNQQIELPAPLPSSVSLMKRIHDHSFRSRVLQLRGESGASEQQQAFGLLREGWLGTLANDKQSPHMQVYRDQIVWGRSPVRIDLAGGWTDTPPYCMYAGGNVVNVAVELNGQPPLQVYVKPTDSYRIILRSIDLGAMEVISDWDELRDYTKVGSPFSIPKAALALAGFLPEFSAERFGSLQEQLKAFGAGLEITLLAAIPAGSGLGTSSILAATVLGTLSDFCGLAWDKNEIGHRTLILEQLLTTGGGWQDQYGGILHGLKLLQTGEGFAQNPTVRWLPDYLFTDATYQPCHLLYYTGITRTAKAILAEIVQGMFLNSQTHLNLLAEMKTHALELFETIQLGRFERYGQLVGKTWEQNKALDAGTNPPAVEAIIRRVEDYLLGCKLPGAGGGGYLYMVAKDPGAAAEVRRILTESPVNANARFVEMRLSNTGFQLSRS
ncbi:MAG: bifunctional fucokinase/fucose-1-phosphate guanylyltransferase [Parabacteroides sp.]